MTDIKISRKHQIDENELRSQLEKLADQIAAQFGIRSDFGNNEVILSGNTVKKGAVTWTADTLSIELTLKMVGKIFKNQIKKEIEQKMNEIVARS